jgi:prepilin-type N-terminal cleavage/methylation domain-containing protein
VRRRQAFTLIELLVVVAIIALLISILLPSLARARELSKRSVCAANLKGIGTACHIYGNENEEWFPISNYATPTGATNDASSVAWSGALGLTPASTVNFQTTAANNTSGHASRSLFLLIIGGGSTAGQFICPSAGETADDMRNLNAAVQTAAQPGVNRFDFKGYNNLSYGYQMPWGKNAKPRINLDPRFAFMADKGPFFEGVATGNQIHDQLISGAAVPNFTDVNAFLTASNDAWRPYNSRNHNGEGQLVLYADTHSEWLRKPIVGVNNDNIYTNTISYTNLLDSLKGRIPDNAHAPYTNTDSVIIP